MKVKYAVGAVLGMTCLFLGVVGALAGDMGEPLPKGYKSNACVTKQHDMAVSQNVYDDFSYELHFIGCEGSKRLHGACSRLAYDVARDWIKSGQPVLNLTVDKMGRALDARMRHHGVKSHDCAINGEGVWT